jgi:non-specific serine/threonine protein kinase
VQRAQDADASFALSNATVLAIAAICARLDGLPLAIELAAAKVRVLPPAALLARLERQLPLLTGGARDVEARQQTMRATLEWSEGLLNPEEQRLFQRLSVFVGGFTLEAAEAVCAPPEGVEPLALSVLDGLASLMDQSLVQRQTVSQDGADTEREEEGGGEARYRLHYVVREYALGRLEASGEAELVRRAHLAHYLGLAEGSELAVLGRQPAPWLGRLEREHDNFRGALGWAREQGEAELGQRLASSLGPFWNLAGHISEALDWLEGLLALAPGPTRPGINGEGTANEVTMPSQMRAKALLWAGTFAWRQGRDEQALVALNESLALVHNQPPEWVAALALYFVGAITWERGEVAGAVDLFEEGLSRLHSVGEPWLMAAYIAALGGIASERNDLQQARAYLEESLALARQAGAAFTTGDVLGDLVEVARRQGDLARAEHLGREQLMIWQQIGVRGFLAGGLESLAFTAAAGGHSERAARLLGAATALRESMGIPRRAWWREHTELQVKAAQATLGEERWAAAFEAGKAMTLEETIAEALGEKD